VVQYLSQLTDKPSSPGRKAKSAGLGVLKESHCLNCITCTFLYTKSTSGIISISIMEKCFKKDSSSNKQNVLLFLESQWCFLLTVCCQVNRHNKMLQTCSLEILY